MPTLMRSLRWPVAVAIGLHALLAWGLTSHWNAAMPSSRTVLAISLLPAEPLRQGVNLPNARAVLSSPTPFDSANADSHLAPARQAKLTSSSESTQSSSEAMTSPLGASGALASDQSLWARSEHFFRARELTRLPALPGEPLIDLGADVQTLSGSLALELFIDESGRVVERRIESDQGLPSAIVEKLTMAFSGYPYLPGERQGKAVKSRVTLVITVTDGQAAVAGPP